MTKYKIFNILNIIALTALLTYTETNTYLIIFVCTAFSFISYNLFNLENKLDAMGKK